MRKHASYVAAAVLALAAGSVSFGADTFEEQATPHQRVTQQDAKLSELKVPAGAKVVENVKTDAMLETIREIANSAVSKDSFDSIVNRFVDQDRNRIGDYGNKDFDDLNVAAAKIQEQWKAKYNQADFKIDDASKLFVGVQAVEGEIQDPNAVIGHWPAPVLAAAPSGEPIRASARQPLTEDDRTQGNIDKGREIGIVRLPGLSGLPALDLSMVDELGGWKLDLPNSRSGQQIHDDLLRKLNWLGQNQAQWPADVNDARRFLTHHVLMAICGVDVQGVDMRK